MKYILATIVTGTLVLSSMGFAENTTPSISDLRIVNEQVASNTVNPDPTARHRGWRYRGHRGYRYRGYRWGRGFFFFGGQPEGNVSPDSLPSPQGE